MLMPHANALIIEETLAAIQLRKDFRRVIKHNLVMDFATYSRRFGCHFGKDPKENKNNLPCEPMVYVDAGHANPPHWYEGNIVSKSRILGDPKIISVVDEHFPDVMFRITQPRDKYGYYDHMRLEMVARAEDGKFHLDENDNDEGTSGLITVLAQYSKWPEGNSWFKDR